MLAADQIIDIGPGAGSHETLFFKVITKTQKYTTKSSLTLGVT